MQILSILFLQFLFIYLSLIIGVPGTTNLNILNNKIMLFFGLFLFQIFVKSINSTKKKCTISINKIISDACYTSILGIVGYSIYIDLFLMDYTKEFINSFGDSNNIHSLLISGIITLVVLFFKIIELLMGNKNDCLEIINL